MRFCVLGVTLLMLACGSMWGPSTVRAQPQQHAPDAQPSLPASPRVALLFAERLPRTDTASQETRARDRWLSADKGKHAAASFFLTLGGQYVFERKARLDRDPALALSLGAGALVGLGKEVYDWQMGSTGYFSRKDLVADGLGLLLAAGVVLL